MSKYFFATVLALALTFSTLGCGEQSSEPPSEAQEKAAPEGSEAEPMEGSEAKPAEGSEAEPMEGMEGSEAK